MALLAQIGFSVLCVILGGQTLASINNVLPLSVGIVIISLSILAICCSSRPLPRVLQLSSWSSLPAFGYNVLHHWERYAWIAMFAMFAIFVVLYGVGSKGGYVITTQVPLEEEGASVAGSVLSFGDILFGACSGWAPIGECFLSPCVGKG